jgi:hypothetical protein
MWPSSGIKKTFVFYILEDDHIVHCVYKVILIYLRAFFGTIIVYIYIVLELLDT